MTKIRSIIAFSILFAGMMLALPIILTSAFVLAGSLIIALLFLTVAQFICSSSPAVKVFNGAIARQLSK